MYGIEANVGAGRGEPGLLKLELLSVRFSVGEDGGG